MCHEDLDDETMFGALALPHPRPINGITIDEEQLSGDAADAADADTVNDEEAEQIEEDAPAAARPVSSAGVVEDAPEAGKYSPLAIAASVTAPAVNRASSPSPRPPQIRSIC